MASPGNWMHLQYQSKLQARKALSKDGKVFGDTIMVGVKPCIDKVSGLCDQFCFIMSDLHYQVRFHFFPPLLISECDGQQCRRVFPPLNLFQCPAFHFPLNHQTTQCKLQELQQRLPGNLEDCLNYHECMDIFNKGAYLSLGGGRQTNT